MHKTHRFKVAQVIHQTSFMFIISFSGMLRIQHGFCQAAPMLLLQLYLMSDRFMNDSDSDTIISEADTAFFDMNTVAASLSLFSVCWSLASFSKNVRLQNVHRLVLTWLGVIFQVYKVVI